MRFTTLHHQANAFTCLLVKFDSPRLCLYGIIATAFWRQITSSVLVLHYVHGTSVDSPSRRPCAPSK